MSVEESIYALLVLAVKHNLLIKKMEISFKDFNQLKTELGTNIFYIDDLSIKFAGPYNFVIISTKETING